MKGYKVFRDNTFIYDDLYYVWTYIPERFNKNVNKITKKSLYKKHVCGVGFYSRYHAKHVIFELLGEKALTQIHLIRGHRLIQQGITSVKGRHVEHVFINNSARRIKRWIYPPEFRFDSHRRRHFIVHLVKTAEEKGVKAFNLRYKRYFYGYRQSFPWSYYKQKMGKIRHAIIQKVWASRGFDPRDYEVL